ncbi:uncharacterized protein LOC119086080 [Bradysia coprophila]|uniref:uncharacterized protein LOC119086080 n=1 Tax=Bradysia coprophila TaxID=38358 RepID=UPI00187D978C|nr:uncharacterized protein LOC119086080 [Bradysia coprophila]
MDTTEDVVRFIKREALLDGDCFTWADSEQPTRPEIDKFVVLQEGKKVTPVSQVSVDFLRKLRGKHVNVYVYSYGKKICNKAAHTKFSAQLLIPEKRDRANADSTVSLMEIVSKLKEIHGTHYSSNHSSWVMWANYIQCAPANESRERMMNECPPAHLILLFRSVAFSDNERMQSARNGLKITDNMTDSFKGQVKLFREDFETMRQSTMRVMELMEWRLKSLEEIIESNQRLVAAMTDTLRPEENEVSRGQDILIMDCEDTDHMDN